MVRRRTAILVSGSGSNLQALLDDSRVPGRHSSVELVISNRPQVRALDRAEAAGIPAVVIDHRAYPSRAAFDAELNGYLQAAAIDLVCLAGFMRVLTSGFVEAWQDRLVNIHPSLLPAFPGLHTHARALAAGVRVAGCTVHFVRAEVDAGPIIAQGVVKVLAGDTPEVLGERVLRMEHRLYPVALELVASGRAYVEGDIVETNDEEAERRRLQSDL
jgi:phosphoribosylglycinamide formyltransferase 1